VKCAVLEIEQRAFPILEADLGRSLDAAPGREQCCPLSAQFTPRLLHQPPGSLAAVVALGLVAEQRVNALGIATLRRLGIKTGGKLWIGQMRLRTTHNQAREQAEAEPRQSRTYVWRWKGGPHGVRQLAKAEALGYCLRRMLAIVGSRPALALGAALVSLACSGPPPRTVNASRPLDERRAIELIVEAFRNEHDRAVPGGNLTLSDTQTLHVDVNGQDRKYGVAYVTASERILLGPTLPPRDPAMGDALQLVSGLGSDGDARVLVLQDSDYVFDDHGGDAHEASTFTAELKLKRDVHDFLVRAHKEKWP